MRSHPFDIFQAFTQGHQMVPKPQPWRQMNDADQKYEQAGETVFRHHNVAS